MHILTSYQHNKQLCHWLCVFVTKVRKMIDTPGGISQLISGLQRHIKQPTIYFSDPTNQELHNVLEHRFRGERDH